MNAKHLQGLLVLVASATPREKLLEDLEEACKEARLRPDNKEAQALVAFHAQLILINIGTDGKFEKAAQMLERMDHIDKMSELVKPADN